MNKFVGGLIAAAVALGIVAVWNARRAVAGAQTEQQAPPAQQPAPGTTQDQGMVIQRNGPLDNGIAIRSPFNGDPGIVSHARSNGRS